MLTADDGGSGLDSSNTPGPGSNNPSDSGNMAQPDSSAVPHGAAAAESKLEQSVNPDLNAGNVGAMAAGTSSAASQGGDVVSRAVANTTADAAAVQQNENQAGDVVSRAVDRAASQSVPTAGGAGGASVNPFFHTDDESSQTPSSSNDEQAKKSFGGPPLGDGTGGGPPHSGPNIFFHPKPVDDPTTSGGSSQGGGDGGSSNSPSQPVSSGTTSNPAPTASTEDVAKHFAPAVDGAGDGAADTGVKVTLPGMPHGAPFGISSITSEVQKNLDDVVTLPPTTNDTRPTTGFEGFSMGGQSAADPGTTQAHN